MIDRDYCLMMSRYNRWQNKQLQRFLQDLTPKDLTRDRGAFFGSILETVNHLLWGDHLWISRFDGGAGPDVDGKDSVILCPTLAAWSAERFRMDGRIELWAKSLDNIDLKGDLTWYSGIMGRDVSKPMEQCVMGFFNHQTHHRGQVHAMLTATGSKAPVSDLIFMPEEF
ncbi:DinB family protein [Arenibacterium sp. CAU 1754]